MGRAQQRGFENEKELGSMSDGSDGSDEGAESDRKLESLGAMEFEWERELLCVRCGWVTVLYRLPRVLCKKRILEILSRGCHNRKLWPRVLGS